MSLPLSYREMLEKHSAARAGEAVPMAARETMAEAAQEKEAVEANWVVEVGEALRSMPGMDAEAEYWKKRSIYKVPACVTDLNRKAFLPQLVSFGPYHHDREHLKPMEEHKARALLHFLRRSRKPFQLFLKAMFDVLDDLMACYDPLDQKWHDDRNAFLHLMILDGCFMLEVLRMETVNDYAANDPMFSNHGKLYIVPYIRRDMLMLENQLPMLVLEKLVAVESEGSKDKEFVNKLILKFCAPGMPIMKMGKCLHVLDVFRKSVLHQGPSKKTKRRKRSDLIQKGGDEIIRSAMELDEAGIRFKKSKSMSLKDISFSGGVLRLPVIVVDDTTESMFLNLIAFERFHVGAGNEVTSYIFFMDNIIDNERDVALLHAKGIIQNAIGSDKAVAKLFNSLSKDVTLDPESSLDVVHKKVSDYCKKPWNMWRANLIHTYFRNPWAILSLVGAIFLFALTIVSTIYGALQYYQG